MTPVIPWNLGKTKLTHSGLARIAEARRQKNNFAVWQKAHPVRYAQLHESADLAELYGTLLGDGCIEKYARTERLVIAFNSKEVGHIARVERLIQRIFKKKPVKAKMGKANCIRLWIYQKNISGRLKFPTGEKADHQLIIPDWIKNHKQYLVQCLKGLFETDGDWVIDKKYGTNVVKFTNIIESLLDDVRQCLIQLGFPANRGNRRVTISQQKKVQKFVNLIKFRQYK